MLRNDNKETALDTCLEVYQEDVWLPEGLWRAFFTSCAPLGKVLLHFKSCVRHVELIHTCLLPSCLLCSIMIHLIHHPDTLHTCKCHNPIRDVCKLLIFSWRN